MGYDLTLKEASEALLDIMKAYREFFLSETAKDVKITLKDATKGLINIKIPNIEKLKETIKSEVISREEFEQTINELQKAKEEAGQALSNLKMSDGADPELYKRVMEDFSNRINNLENNLIVFKNKANAYAQQLVELRTNLEKQMKEMAVAYKEDVEKKNRC